MAAIEFLVEYRERGETIAGVLRKRFQLTWTRAKNLVAGGHVRVAGQITRAPEQRVKKGNRVWIAAGTLEVKTGKPKASPPPVAKKAKTPKAEAPAPKSNHKIEILYSDDTIAVVNKPINLTTVRNSEEAEEFGPRAKKFLPQTLADLLPALLGAPNKPVYAVHRLDRDTSGIVVFARNKAASEKLTDQFRKHSTERHYLALTRGTPPERRINTQLAPDRGDGRRGSLKDSPDAKSATTHVRVKEVFEKFALVECKLETGRTHQVRIHLGEIGFPLCGEKIYDRPLHGKPWPDGSGAKRPMLHAAKLAFDHPETGVRMSWDIAPPPDFAQLLQAFRTK